MSSKKPYSKPEITVLNEDTPEFQKLKDAIKQEQLQEENNRHLFEE